MQIKSDVLVAEKVALKVEHTLHVCVDLLHKPH